MDYIVSHPTGAIVNGKRFQRGDVLTGADAQAVENSRILQHRCTPKRPSAPAPSAPSASASRVPAYDKE